MKRYFFASVLMLFVSVAAAQKVGPEGEGGAPPEGAYEEGGLFFSDSSCRVLVGCRPEMTSVTVPPSVQVISRCAFAGHHRLVDIVLPEGLDSIDDKAFEGCNSLGSLTIPSTVTAIGDGAFLGAFSRDGSATVTIADAAASIGRNAFSHSNIAAIRLGAWVRNIGEGAFAFCHRLRLVSLPEGIDTIHAELFHGCMHLCEVGLPASLVCIDSMAFAECSGLDSVVLPEGLVFIGEYAFSQCSRLSGITLLAVVPPQTCSTSFDGVNSSITIHVPCGSLMDYRFNPYWVWFYYFVGDCDGLPEVPLGGLSVVAGRNCLVVSGDASEPVWVFDVQGRQVAYAECQGCCTVPLPAAGIYLVRVGRRPLCRVVVGGR